MREPDRGDWVERMARLAGWLGFNAVSVRWRLERWRQRSHSARAQAREKIDHLAYEHKVCPRCGRIHDRQQKICSGCGARLGGRSSQVLQRIGLSLPRALSVSSVLGLLIVVVYARLVLAEGGPDAIWSLSVGTLYAHGGHFAPAVRAGEWWRLGTAIFLHAGIWHLGFNLFALSQIGPHVEEVFGPGRMLLFFMLTGLLASLGSDLLGLEGIGIGASGAVMGLCGLSAGWGQRRGGSVGLQVRNLMLKWAVYTLVFGLLIGADHAAHFFGFASGGLIGFAFRPESLQRSQRKWVLAAQLALGAAAALTFCVLCLVPPAGVHASPFEPRDENPYAELLEICELEHQGRISEAVARYRAQLTGLDTTAPGPEELRAACRWLEEQKERCRAFRVGGLEAIAAPPALPRDERGRLEMERQIRSMCDYLGE
ncbi:MAG: rhomboid family intramembrane serine protease [Deltaproteobacteria bacterium]|nr:rhomboid family intramembrane serine protease [Deltaproteobacteria bacterium]